MSSDYFKRYTNGEYEKVWEELLVIGEGIYNDDIYRDVLNVVYETINRCKHNIKLIVSRLKRIKYEFGFYSDGSLSYFRGAIVKPSKNIKKQINDLEVEAGKIPLSLKVFWEMIGGVDFTGKYSDWECTDQLMVYPIEAAIEEYQSWLELCELDGKEETGAYKIPIAPDDLTKDNISGGCPYEITIPNSSVDAMLENEWHDTTFINYLRMSVACCGFPGLVKDRKSIPKELILLRKQFVNF